MTMPNPYTCTADELAAFLAELMKAGPLTMTLEGGGVGSLGNWKTEWADLVVLPRVYLDAMVRLLGPVTDSCVATGPLTVTVGP